MKILKDTISGKFKPSGPLRLAKRPRGAIACMTFDHHGKHWPWELYSGQTCVVTGGTRALLRPTPWGIGCGLGDFTGTESVSCPCQKTNLPFSLEALLYYELTTSRPTTVSCTEGSVVTGILSGQLFVDSSSQPVFSIYNGVTTIRVTGPVMGDKGLYHLLGTSDGISLRFYVNGIHAGTTVIGGTGPYILTNPYMLIGGQQANADNAVPSISGRILIAQFANVCWTESEVMERSVNPYGHLYSPANRAALIMKSVVQTIDPALYSAAQQQHRTHRVR